MSQTNKLRVNRVTVKNLRVRSDLKTGIPSVTIPHSVMCATSARCTSLQTCASYASCQQGCQQFP